jgi:hypothetical protein
MNANVTRMVGLTLCSVMLCATSNAAPPGPRDPDWPCQQIKVPQLSLAAVWSGPSVDPQNTNWQQDPDLAALVHETAQRREPVEQAEAQLHRFAQEAGAQKEQKLLLLVAGLFTVLDNERGSVIDGLDRFGARQKELAAGIRADNEKLHQLQADPAADPNQVNQLVQKVTWEAAVFQDRRQALRYACDVPGKIEHRLFALAQSIQKDLQ